MQGLRLAIAGAGAIRVFVTGIAPGWPATQIIQYLAAGLWTEAIAKNLSYFNKEVGRGRHNIQG